MADKIFINYRREDSIGIAGRLHDRLARKFGRHNLFMDVDNNLPHGDDFAEQTSSCMRYHAGHHRSQLAEGRHRP